MCTPPMPTRRDKTVSSRRRRRCVLSVSCVAEDRVIVARFRYLSGVRDGDVLHVGGNDSRRHTPVHQLSSRTSNQST